MERIVLVHGSVVGGRGTWAAQRPLAEQFELLVLDRPGFPPNPPVERIDFESDGALVADVIEPGDHLVGHSYGGIVSLLAAALRPDALRSLTVIEPPATRVAVGVPAVDAFAAAGVELYASARTGDPDVYLRRFLAAVGSEFDPPSPLPPELEQGARTLTVERGPWEADLPLATIASASFPKLVVSGAHLEAHDVICDVLERELSAERVVLPGYGHVVQRHPEFNAVLSDFVERAAAGHAADFDSSRSRARPDPRHPDDH
jgi:pimeloyl-ACP methyl ester carboxylesterase